MPETQTFHLILFSVDTPQFSVYSITFGFDFRNLLLSLVRVNVNVNVNEMGK